MNLQRALYVASCYHPRTDFGDDDERNEMAEALVVLGRKVALLTEQSFPTDLAGTTSA